jgi:hypothetical protein
VSKIHRELQNYAQISSYGTDASPWEFIGRAVEEILQRHFFGVSNSNMGIAQIHGRIGFAHQRWKCLQSKFTVMSACKRCEAKTPPARMANPAPGLATCRQIRSMRPARARMSRVDEFGGPVQTRISCLRVCVRTQGSYLERLSAAPNYILLESKVLS